MVRESRADPEATGNTVLSAFAGVSFFLALIQIGCLVLGLGGVRLNQPLAILVLASALLLSWLGGRWREKKGESGADAPPVDGTRAPSVLERILVGGLVLWAGFTWIRLWVLAGRRSPYDWDGLYYHIPTMNSWTLAGGVVWVENIPDIPFVHYPMGVEAFTFFMHQVLGTDRLVDACNLWYWPLAFLASVVLAERLGAGGLWRWSAGALVAAVPVLLSQSVTCYVDPAFAATVMGSIASSCVLIFRRGGPAWWKVLLWAANIGLMAGSKGTGLVFATFLLLMVPLWALARRGWGRWRAGLKHIAFAALIVLAVGGHWYVRNAVMTGNPIYPLKLQFGEKTLIEGWDHILFSEANLPPWLEEYPPKARMFVSWLQLDAPIHGYDPVGGLGYIWLAGGIPAFLYLWSTMLFRDRASRRRIRELAFLTAVVILLLTLQASPWWSRFTIWFHALGLPCMAVVLGRAMKRWRAVKYHLVTLAVGGMVIALGVWEAETTMAIEWKTGRDTREGRASHAYQSSRQYMFPGLGEIPVFDDFFHAQRIARSYWGPTGTLMGGVLALPLGEREIRVLPLAPTESDLVGLREAGIRWVIWDVLGAGEVPEILKKEAVEEHIYREGPDVDFRIIRLRSPSMAPAP